MAVGIQFTAYVPSNLLATSTSPTMGAEVVTGTPLPTGAFPGNAFFLNESQAQQASGGQCHQGWYAEVYVDPSATAANIAQGYVGHQLSIAGDNAWAPGCLTVTDASHGLGIGINPVVFLGAAAPGTYCYVQLAGDGLLYGSAAISAVGNILSYANTGKVASATGTYAANLTAANAGISKATTAGAGLVRAEIAFPFGIV